MNGPADGIIVGKQWNRLGHNSGCHIHNTDGAVQEVGDIVLAVIRHHARRNGSFADRNQVSYGVRVEVEDGGIPRESIGSNHGLAIMPHPVPMRMTFINVDSPLDICSSGSELHHRGMAVLALQSNMKLVCIRASHHVRWIGSYFYVMQQPAGEAIKC